MAELITSKTEPCGRDRSAHLERAIHDLETELNESHEYDYPSQQWTKIRRCYYDLTWASVARDVYHCPSEGFRFDHPHDGFTVGDGRVVFFGNIRVRDPANPFISHSLTHDYLIDEDGEIDIEINAVPLDEAGTRPGSFIR